MRKLVIGILAHVDAGKTTLSEALLYQSGSIRKIGRVDNKDAFLDTEEIERERGITVFSKQAVFSYKDMEIYWLDTPGHVDFSAEMERTLQVLDYAVLVVSGADGVQGHTKTLWRLLTRYHIPVFLFINKMDQMGTDKEKLLEEAQRELDSGCIDFMTENTGDFYENIAVCDEAALEQFLESGILKEAVICRLIKERKVFPCFFGSALKINGVDKLLEGIRRYTEEPEYPQVFGARVFKIARDTQGNRLTWLKVTGGALKVKDKLSGKGWEEKVNQIRIYSGDKYETAGEAGAGTVCAVTGLTQTGPGEGLGQESLLELPVLEPLFHYKVLLPQEVDAAVMLPKLRMLEEEEPQLHVVWEEKLQEIQVRIMGEVQLEVLQRLIKDRFSVQAEFVQGSVLYRETIERPVIGVGHFEPLKHYAEVHLLLEPGEAGSGLCFAADCSEDILAKNWQRLALTHLEEKEHRGVLTGAPITDIKVTLIAGRAHQKHTEGGDFRQATYRALRQGLMETTSVLLEPYYAFTLEIPERQLGRAMTDLERLSADMELPQIEEGRAILKGCAPVTTLHGYQKEVTAYTQGTGRLHCALKGYYPCHNTEEVLERTEYSPEEDLENPAGSVFCAHGAGFIVPWDEVKAHMHLKDSAGWDKKYAALLREKASDKTKEQTEEGYAGVRPSAEKGSNGSKMRRQKQETELFLGTEEVDLILERTFQANKRDKNAPRKGIYRRGQAAVNNRPVSGNVRPIPAQEEYLLVDGYNIIFAWEELADIAKASIDGARGRLLDILCDYQAMRGCRLIVVFDAYRVQGHVTEILEYHNIHVVYTGEAETADRYIERFAHENGKKYRVVVATSDGLEQIIIRGQGCGLLSARELREEIERQRGMLREEYLNAPKEKGSRYYLLDGFEVEGED